MQFPSSLFSAPFFTTWFCNSSFLLYLPLYVICKIVTGTKKSGMRSAMRDSMQSFRERGFTLGE
jgi:solute carrier family 35 protein F3/4